MAAQAFLLIGSFLLLLFIAARPLGGVLAKMIANQPLPGTAGIERGLWRLLGVGQQEMGWRRYLLAILALNAAGIVLLFALLMLQHLLPLNPQRLPGLSWDLALNTAISFVTNTNWQAYAGESTLSCFSQMVGLTVQNFLSAATGIAVAFALIRGFCRRGADTLGNAWVDLVRVTLWLLLPLALIIALVMVQQGTLQNLLPYQHFISLEGAKGVLPDGPGRLTGGYQDARHQRRRLL
ncbi:potassium-transporting ATPase subunit A [Pluralibacter gergoviae]|nr:potassium-transporting ATPase subunit A [Pluralibacter gergoviae]